MSERNFIEVVEGVSHAGADIARYARIRLACELLGWPFRKEFASIWEIVDRIPGWFREPNAIAIYAAVRAEPPRTIVEIGSYLGRSTVFFGLCMKNVNPRGRVVAIDPHTGDRQQLEALAIDHLPSFALFREHCRATGVEPWVDARCATSRDVAEGWSGTIDLLYVDGWHSYQAVLDDGRAWLPHLSNHGVVFFDDYVTYSEVRSAVHQLATEGHFHLWGRIFGQAVGGAAPHPPDAVKRAIRASSPTLTVRPSGLPRTDGRSSRF